MKRKSCFYMKNIKHQVGRALFAVGAMTQWYVNGWMCEFVWIYIWDHMNIQLLMTIWRCNTNNEHPFIYVIFNILSIRYKMLCVKACFILFKCLLLLLICCRSNFHNWTTVFSCLTKVSSNDNLFFKLFSEMSAYVAGLISSKKTFEYEESIV